MARHDTSRSGPATPARCYSSGMNKERPPHILVADDDPVSLRFLVTVLDELGCAATAVTTGDAALAACRADRFDLLLLDRRMPGLGGAPLLRALRSGGCAALAIATSAEVDPAIRTELTAAGYVEVVVKPVGVERLAAVLAAHLPDWPARRPGAAPQERMRPPAAPGWIEHERALASVGGDARTLQALRGLFTSELETALPRLAAMPAEELGDWLHRLRASCRYCGAMRLGEEAEKLERRLAEPADLGAAELAGFLDACRQTIRALVDTLPRR